MKKQFLFLASIACLIACNRSHCGNQTHKESDNISRETRIDTLTFEDNSTGESISEYDTTYYETEVKDAIVYVPMNGKNFELNTIQNTVKIELEEGEYTKTIRRDLINPCE